RIAQTTVDVGGLIHRQTPFRVDGGGRLAHSSWELRKESPMPMQLIGDWEIVSSDDFDDEYLNLEGTPYIRLQQDGDRIVGEYHIGVQSGGVDGRPQPDGSILFTFGGMDETDEVHGAGT